MSTDEKSTEKSPKTTAPKSPKSPAPAAAESKPAPAEGKPATAKGKPAGADSATDDNRRVRRSRKIAGEAAPKAKSATPDLTKRRRKPADGPQRSKTAAVGAAPRSNVYTQDPVEHVPVPLEPEGPPVKQLKESQITLILHPAPKAGTMNKKRKAALTPKEAMQAKASKRRGSKGKQTKAKAKAPTKLEPAWLKAKGADAVAALTSAGNAASEALVQQWLKDENYDAIKATAADVSISGKGRKAVRRAANVLKSRGLDVELAKAHDPAPADVAHDAVASLVTPDAAGVVFISISQRLPSGRYQVADVGFRVGTGVMHASGGYIAGKQIKAWQKRVADRYGAAPVEIPLDWARSLIAKARAANDVSKQILPLGYDRCKELIEPAPKADPSYPLSHLAKAASEPKADTNHDLHQDPEFAAWIPPKEALDELLLKVGEKIGDDDREDQEKVDAALKEEIAAATDRYFTPEVREELAERMQFAALSVQSRAGDDDAKQVLQLAVAIRKAGLVTAPPREIGFLVRFFEKGVGVLAQQGQGRLRIPQRA